jgi:YD repeat-containing protein
MQRPFRFWSATFEKLGFRKQTRKSLKPRPLRMETLEQRQMLTSTGIEVSDAQIEEGDDGVKTLQFTVTNHESYDLYGVNVTTSAGTAKSGIDYVHKSASVDLLAEYGGTATFDVEIIGDKIAEDPETFNVNVDYGGGTFTDTATGTIYDNDDPLSEQAGCSTCGNSISTTSTNAEAIGGVAPPSGCSTGACGGGATFASEATERTFPMGNGRISGDQPLIEQTSDGSIWVMLGARNVHIFDPSGSDFVARHDSKMKLTHDAANDLYKMTTADGAEYEFNDFTATHAGVFKSYTNPGGQSRTATIDGGTGAITAIVDGATGTTRTYTYTNSLVTRVVETVTATGDYVSRSDFEYDTDSNLKAATKYVPDAAGTGWESRGTTYYRYYGASESNGYENAVKRILLPEAFTYAKAEAIAKYGTPAGTPTDAEIVDQLSETDIAQFTCYYYEYDANRNLSKQTRFGGSEEFTYSAVETTTSTNVNVFTRITYEWRPDGSAEVIYSNYLGQAILHSVYDGASDQVRHSWKSYDDQGRVVQQSTPVEVDINTTAYTVSIANDAEPVTVLVYGDGTEETPSSGRWLPEGYLIREQLISGPVASRSTETLREMVYAKVALGTDETYYVSEVKEYASATEAAVTTYSNSYHTGTLALKSRVISSPTTLKDDQDNDIPAVREQQFDLAGNMIWSRDERGIITKYEYNAATNVLEKMIEDVNVTIETGSGWAQAAGSGEHLITDYTYDDQGRVIQTLGPVHDVDGVSTRTASWTVYKDVENEVWSAQGYAIESTPGNNDWSDFTLVNPVSISKYNSNGQLTESIQARRASTSGKLVATDTFTQADYTSWSVNQYSKNRLSATAVYHDIPTSTTADPDEDKFIGEEYTAASDPTDKNYTVTRFGYDSVGRQNRVVSPGGTITRTVYDGFGRAVETFVGTDDAASTTDNQPAGSPLYGTLWGDPQWDTVNTAPTAPGGSSLYFDGDGDYVYVDQGHVLSPPQQSMSFFTWMRTDSTDDMWIAQASDLAYPWGGWGIIVNAEDISTAQNGALGFWVGDLTGGYQSVSLGTDAIADEEWHHVGFTIDHGVLVGYWDGVAVLEASPDVELFSAYPTSFGKLLDNDASEFKGNLDDAILYHSAVTEQEVAELFATGAIAEGPTAAARWRFDEGVGLAEQPELPIGRVQGRAQIVSTDEAAGPPVPSNAAYLELRQFEHIIVADEDVGSPTGNTMSFFTWIKTTATSRTALASKHNTSSPWNGWRVWLNYFETDQLHVNLGGGSNMVDLTGKSVCDGEWHHVGFTFDQTTLRVFVDGEQVGGDFTESAPNLTSSNDLHFGDAYGWYFVGSLDEIVLFDSAISTGDVQTLFNTGAVPQNASLMHRWSFDLGQGQVTYSELDTKFGNVYGEPIWDSEDHAPIPDSTGSLVLDSGKRVQVADPTDFIFGEGPFTFAAWVKVRTGSGSNSIVNLGNPVNNGGMGYALYYYENSDQLNLKLRDENNNYISPYIGSFDIADTWAHVAFTVDSSFVKVYLNGQQVKSLANTLTGAVGYRSPYGLSFGEEVKYSSPSSLNGNLDDVRAYHEALTLDQIKNLYAVGEPGRDPSDPQSIEPDPVAHYAFNEGAGATVSPWGVNNMQRVSANVYNDDGTLARTVAYVNDSETRTTRYYYNDKNRLDVVYVHDGTYGTYNKYYYDLRGNTIQTEQYLDDDGDFLTVGAELWTTVAGDDDRLALTRAHYDVLGRAYRNFVYEIDQTSGAIVQDGQSQEIVLTSQTWFDKTGAVVKSASSGSQTFTKNLYDYRGRLAATYVGYDTSEDAAELFDNDGLLDVASLSDDTIFEQSEYTYNNVSQVVETAHRQREHDATGTGELTTPGGTQPQARVTYTAAWYDGVGRQVAAADYGTNGGTAPSRPDSAPDSSETVHVSTTSYFNYDGSPSTNLGYTKSIDPSGRETRTYFDDAGRTVKTIQNYEDGIIETAEPDRDVITETTYTPDGQVFEYIAHNGPGETQTTTYVYGTTLEDSDIARSDLLVAVLYPDSDDTVAYDYTKTVNFGSGDETFTRGLPYPFLLSDGADGLYDRTETTYNRLGQPKTTKDQNGTVHAYTYDDVGRQTLDAITEFGGNIDEATKAIQRTYTPRGQAETVTSYSTSYADAGANLLWTEDVGDWDLSGDRIRAVAAESNIATVDIGQSVAAVEAVAVVSSQASFMALAGRVQDANHMWEIGIRPDQQEIRVWRKENGTRTKVDFSTYAIETGVEYHLRAEFTDVSIKLFINGELAHTMQHESGTNKDLSYLSNATKFGLSSFDDHTTFDDFAVYALPAQAHEQSQTIAEDDFTGFDTAWTTDLGGFVADEDGKLQAQDFHSVISVDAGVANASVSAVVNFTDTSVYSNHGVVARLQDINNRYGACLNTNNEVVLYSKIGGAGATIQNKSYTVTVGVDYNLRLEFDGTTARVYVSADGRPETLEIEEFNLTALSSSTRFGVRSFGPGGTLDNFLVQDNTQTTKAEDNFTFFGRDWTASSGTFTSAGSGLVQTAVTGKNALTTDLGTVDAVVETVFKFTDVSWVASHGISARYLDNNNHLSVSLTYDGQLQLWHVVDNVLTVLHYESGYTVVAGVEYAVKAEFAGDTARIYLDNVFQFEVTDLEITTGTKFGLHSWGDTGEYTHFSAKTLPDLSNTAPLAQDDFTGRNGDLGGIGNNLTPSNALNQVLYVYNNFGQVTKEYQEHQGLVDNDGLNGDDSLYVGYQYADGSANHLRPTGITYPSGRTITYVYNAGTDDALSRVSSVKYGAAADERVDYDYLGLDAVMRTYDPDLDLEFTLAGGTGDDPYDDAGGGGLDRFGRITDIQWKQNGSLVEQYQYGYDRAGNRLWKAAPLAAAAGQDFDELYAYDEMFRLIGMDRGELNATNEGLVGGSLTFSQDYTVDALGNHESFVEDSDGDATADTDEDRTFNEANELLTIDGSASHVAHDKNGAMTRVTKAGDSDDHYDLVRDAWGRIVRIDDGGQTLRAFEFDGLGRRVEKHEFMAGTLDQSLHVYFSNQWQVVEERTGNITTGVIAADPAEQFTYGTRYVDEIIQRLRDTNADGTLNERLHYVQDAVFDVTALVDATGAVVERILYTPHGAAQILTATYTDRTTTAYQNTRLFRGLERDLETQIQRNRNRDYFHWIERWDQRDDGYIDGLNLYRAYFAPNFLDPYGLQEVRASGNGKVQSPRMVNRQDMGTFSVSIQHEGFNELECTKKGISVMYWPSVAEKAKYSQIFLTPYAITTSLHVPGMYARPQTATNWHLDYQSFSHELLVRWPDELHLGAQFDDNPGISLPPWFLPGVSEFFVAQTFEVTAWGVRKSDGKAESLGSVGYGHIAGYTLASRGLYAVACDCKSVVYVNKTKKLGSSISLKNIQPRDSRIPITIRPIDLSEPVARYVPLT